MTTGLANLGRHRPGPPEVQVLTVATVLDSAFKEILQKQEGL